MNPWALVLMGLGIMLIIIGIKGSQHNFLAAITGKSAPSGKG